MKLGFTQLLLPFNNIDSFMKAGCNYNEENTSIIIEQANTLLIRGKKQNNASCITIFHNQPSWSNSKEGKKIYTFSCDFEIKNRLKGIFPNDIPKIALDGIGEDQMHLEITSSISVPNEIGIWHSSLTVTIPENIQKTWFRLHIGAEQGAGDVVIHNMQLTDLPCDVDLTNPLLHCNKNIFTVNLQSLSDEEILQSFWRLKERNSFYLMQEILTSDFTISEQLQTQLHTLYKIACDQKEEIIGNISTIFNQISQKDHFLATQVVQYLADKLQWEILGKWFEKWQQKGWFSDCYELLYLQAQTCRRLQLANEQEIYRQALQLEPNKAKIDWMLFFDKNNPGLSYRRKELAFIMENLAHIQQIADSYIPQNIDFSSSPVFVFWDQGINEAPILVKSMIKRLQKIYSYRLVILDKDNLDLYVDLSAGLKKFRTSYRAQFSDFIRTELLLKYGGTWIDATVFMTKKFADDVDQLLSTHISNTYILRIPNNPLRISNWYIATNQINNRIIALMWAANLIFAEKYNKLFEYYQFHTFFEILTQLDPIAYHDFQNVRKDNYQPYAHDMLKAFQQDFNDETFAQILARSPIQKTTYRAKVNHLRSYSIYKMVLRETTPL